MKKLIASVLLTLLAFWVGATTLDPALFTKKSVLTVSGYAGSSTLANFPVLVRLAANSPSGFAYADVTNGDLRFADADGNALPFEIETWNPSGESHIWVSVPSLSGASTQITMYYGATTGQLPAVDATGVWKNAAYANVMHFSTASGLQNIDSTENALSIALPNTTANTTATAGLLTGAIDNLAGSQLGLKVEANAAWNWSAGEAITVSAWGKRTRDTADRVLFATTGLKVSVNGDTAKATVNGVTATAAIGAVGDWNLYTLVADGATVKLYVNGVAGAATDGAVASSSSALIWGSDGSSRWKGTFDEARLRHGADSADWVKASYDTIMSANFVTAAAVETRTTTAPTFENTYSGTKVEADKFSSRLPLTLTGYAGADAIENLPVLVRLNAISAEGFDVTTLASDGSNFRFADAQGNNLPFEIDTWDTTSGRNVWVTVPYVEGVETKIYLYFDTSAELTANDPTAVWIAAGYRNVMHFQSAKAEKGAYDSTGYADTITVQAATVVSTANGKIGEGSNNTTSGATGYQFTLANEAQWTKGAPVTFSLWALVADGQRPLFGDSAAGGVYSIWATADKKVWAVAGQKTAAATAVGVNVLSLAGGVAANTWAHYTFVCEGSVTKVYVNGTYQGMVATPLPNMTTFNWCAANGGNRLKGNADEVRLHLGAESADFIAASYAAMNDANFLVAGAVQPAVTSYKPEIRSAEANLNALTVKTRLTAFEDGATSVTMTLLYGTTEESLTSEAALGEITEPGELTKTVTGLKFSQQYFLKVKAVDNLGNESLSDIATVTTGADPRLDPKLLRKYSTITISGYAGSTTLENFPVLVKIANDSPVGFAYDDCQADGSDLRFTDEDGVVIPHEIDTWDTTGTSLVWVCVPKVVGQSKTFTMYYGCDDTSVLPSVNAGEVWTKSGFNAVWHFADGTKESAQGLEPSTTVGTLGYATVDGAGVGKALHVTGSQTLGFANDAKWATLGDGSTLTLSLWAKYDASSANYARMLSCMSAWGNKTGWEFTIQNAINQITVGSSAQSQFQYNITPSPGSEMVYLTAVYHANKDVALFVNGSQVYSKALKQVVTPVEKLWIASCNNTGNRWNGKLDEIRIHQTDESSDWVAASYATMKNADFVTMEDVQSTGGTVPLFVKATGYVQEGDHATVYGRLTNLGTGATEASVKLFWGTSPTVDDTCASVDLGTFTDRADLEAALNDLVPAVTYYAAFRAVNNAPTPETVWSSVVSFTVDASTKISDNLIVDKVNCKMTVTAPIAAWGVGTTKVELLVGTSAETLAVAQTIDGMTEKPEGGAIVFSPVQLGVGTYVYVVRATTTYGEIVWTNTTTANSVALTDASTYTWKGGSGDWSDTAMWTTQDEGAGGYPSDGCSIVFGDEASDVVVSANLNFEGITISSVGTHIFRTAYTTKSYMFKVTNAKNCKLVGAGGGTLVLDNVVFDTKITDLAGLGQLALVNNGQAFPANSETTDILLVSGGCIYTGWENKVFGKLILQGGPCRIAGNYTYSFAALETRRGSGVSSALVVDGKVTIRDASTVEMIGGTQTLADATAESPVASQIPVCTQFLIEGSGKGQTVRYGKNLCTMDASGLIRMIPLDSMLTILEDATELDNVCFADGATLTQDLTVNAALFSGATVNLGGHTLTVKSGQCREGTGGMWGHIVSNGTVRLWKSNAIGDSTNNADVRMKIDFATQGNDDLMKPMLAHDAVNSAWAYLSKYAGFTGVVTTPLGKDIYLMSMTAPKMVLELNGSRLTAQTVMQKANFGGLAGVGYISYAYNGMNKYGCNIWLGEMSEDDQAAVTSGTVNGAVMVGNKGLFYPGLIGYDGGRRGTIRLPFAMHGNVPMMCSFQMQAGGTFGASLNADGTCGSLDATEGTGGYVSVALDGTLSVTTTGKVPKGVEYPIIRYREGKLTGKFARVTEGFKVAYDVPQADGTYAVTVTKKQSGLTLIIR